MLKEKLLSIYNEYGEEDELLEYRITPLRRFIRLIGMDPEKMSQKQIDKISSGSRYKQWLSTKRILHRASESNKHNPNLKEDLLDENRFAGWTAKKFHRHLLDNGFELEGGSKHFGYVHKKTGRKIKPIPNHKGDIPPGTAKGILNSIENIVNGINEADSYQPKDYEIGKGIKSPSGAFKIYKRKSTRVNKNTTNLLPTATLKSELVNKGFDVHTTTNITTKGLKKGFRATPKEKLKATKGKEHYLIRMKQSGTAFKGQTAQRLKSLYQKEDIEHFTETKVEKLLKKNKQIKKTMTGKQSSETDLIQVNPELTTNKPENSND
jgi:predicted RNA binding protein YcfA (HicA-like mRNA interferase family)